MKKTNKYSPSNSKIYKSCTIFSPNAIQFRFEIRFNIGLDIRLDICFEVKYSDQKIVTFLLHLLFKLGYRGLLFASTMNLEGRPRFAGIC